MWVVALLASVAFSTETLTCGSNLNPSNFSSKLAMEANGWVFSWTDSVVFRPNHNYCNDIPSTSYCGWMHHAQYVGKLSLILELSGYSSGWVEIDYGDNYGLENDEWNGTSLFLNDELVDNTTTTSRKFGIAFADGDVLMLAERGVMVINSIVFNCSSTPETCNLPINTTNITALTDTGWAKPATEINYGNDGLVGHWWWDLLVEWNFSKTMTLVGAKTDYDGNPFYIYYGTEFEIVTNQMTGSTTFNEEIIAQRVRVKWNSTKGVNGIHFQFLGCETSPEAPTVTACATDWKEYTNLVSIIRKGISSQPCFWDHECSIHDTGALCSLFICSCSDGSTSPPPCMV